MYRFAPDIALTQPQQQNLYAMAMNNPLRWRDLSGLSVGDPHIDSFSDSDFLLNPYDRVIRGSVTISIGEGVDVSQLSDQALQGMLIAALQNPGLSIQGNPAASYGTGTDGPKTETGSLDKMEGVQQVMLAEQPSPGLSYPDYKPQKTEPLGWGDVVFFGGVATGIGGAFALDFALPGILGGTAAAGSPGVQDAAEESMVLVSRWGRQGLQTGDWVMKGAANWWNYILSGKWQPGFGNQFAPPSSGQQFYVPLQSLQGPQEFWVTDWIKNLMGQRMYIP
jgi:hypothetical protein